MPYPVELPPKYYLAHFRELLRDIEARLLPYLRPRDELFLRSFATLSEDAQCLYIRMVNRKGRYFTRHGLDYQEINSKKALSELRAVGFIREATESDKDGILAIMPKEELFRMLSAQDVPYRKSWPRQTFIELASLHFILPESIVVQEMKDEMDYLLFLFFGSYQENLTLYTLRDLGVRESNGYQGPLKNKFKSRADAEAHFFYARMARNELSEDPIGWPVPLSFEARELRDQQLIRKALHYEGDEAVRILRLGEGPAPRERLCRLLWELDRREECQDLLRRMQEDPAHDEEALFAEDFLARKFEKKRLSVLTEALREARKITIDEGFFRHPELGAIAWFEAQGAQAFHSENLLWQELFQRLFKEELFESEATAFHSQFEHTPFDLWDQEFFTNHQASLRSKLVRLHDPAFRAELAADSAPLLLLLEKVPLTALETILIAMARDYHRRSSGFPDLLVCEGDSLRLIEIKAPGDQLRKNQLTQLTLLRRAGIEVEVLQVDYDANPAQTYVVVDLETTGTSSSHHRVTEIGAVKIQDGKIIATYSSLVNPGQPIPRRIQQLTGISNEMVEAAPSFAAVADAFEEFLEGSILAAHNVKFDYGFLQAEYARLERRFVRPHVCTSASMKKHFPGLGSYGLANLTTHFNIPLESHHRALCDAEAAARLLMIINEKRRVGSPTPSAES